jgi:Holliday junction resolvase RusA-like endonuclease
MRAPLEFEVSIPPSVNNLYINRTWRDKKSGKRIVRRVMTKKARSYKQAAAWEVKGAALESGWEYTGKRISFHMDLVFRDRRRRDITNCIKIVEDAAAEALGFDDTVVDVCLVRRMGVDKHNPRARVSIQEIESPNEIHRSFA